MSNEIAAKVAVIINGYKNNPTIMGFVKTEALEKVAAEIRAEIGGGTTAKAVEILALRHKNIESRVQDYIAAGLIGCYMTTI